MNNTNLNSELMNLGNNNEDVLGELNPISTSRTSTSGTSASKSASSTSSALVKKIDTVFVKQLKEIKQMRVSPEEARPVTDYLTKLSIKLSTYGNPELFTTLIDHDLEILRSIQLYAKSTNLNPKVEAIFKGINPQLLSFRNISVESFLKKSQDINFLMAYLDVRSKLLKVKKNINDEKLNERLVFIEENSKKLHKECRKNPGKMELDSIPNNEIFALSLKEELEKSKLFKTIFKKSSMIYEMYKDLFTLVKEIQLLPDKLIDKGITDKALINFIISYTFGRIAIFANMLLQHLLLILNTISPIDRRKIEPLLKEAKIELADILDFKFKLVLDPELMVPIKLPGTKRGGAYTNKTKKLNKFIKNKKSMKK